MRIILVLILALSFSAFAAEKYGVYDVQGTRISTFEAESHELLEKTQQVKSNEPGKNLYISSFSKGKVSKPISRYRYKAETGAYIEASRKETFSICLDKEIQGTWISEHSVSLNEENCLSVQTPDLAGTFRILFMENSGLTDTIQVLVEQSYIQMGDYSHKIFVVDSNAIDSIIRSAPNVSWRFDILPGNYENRSYSQPLIVDKTKFTIGDANYYSENGNIPKSKNVYNLEILNPKKFEKSKLPYLEYMNWAFANERSKKENLDTAYRSVDGRIVLDTSAFGYRLPSEEEWFFLMRAGASTRYYWGDKEDSLTVSRYAWVRPVGLRPVAQLQPNKFGLYDMVGIASERVTEYKLHKCPEYHFMDEITTVLQVMKIPPKTEKCSSRRNEKGERESWTCVEIVERKPMLVNEKASFGSFRLLRKTPKLHKLDKF